MDAYMLTYMLRYWRDLWDYTVAYLTVWLKVTYMPTLSHLLAHRRAGGGRGIPRPHPLRAAHRAPMGPRGTPGVTYARPPLRGPPATLSPRAPLLAPKWRRSAPRGPPWALPALPLG